MRKQKKKLLSIIAKKMQLLVIEKVDITDAVTTKIKDLL
jgi:hypothetical protein